MATTHRTRPGARHDRRGGRGGGGGGGGGLVLLVLAGVAVLLLANHLPAGPPEPGPGRPGAVVAPVPGGRVSSGYGTRSGQMHYGTDIAAPLGTPIRAIADADVIEAGPAAGFGLWVRLRHTSGPDAGTVSVYGHMQTITTRTGAHVRAGEQIATVGSRGQSTGPHLHLEIWPGGRRAARINPAFWFDKRHAALT